MLGIGVLVKNVCDTRHESEEQGTSLSNDGRGIITTKKNKRIQ